VRASGCGYAGTKVAGTTSGDGNECGSSENQ
jgi:hypothetical protein